MLWKEKGTISQLMAHSFYLNLNQVAYKMSQKPEHALSQLFSYSHFGQIKTQNK